MQLEAENEIESVANKIDEAELKPNIKNIKQEIYKKLEPVFALRAAFRMKNGVGGTTITTYGDGESFFIKH